MLEMTISHGGYFFRQYPLLVAGQIVENKPQGKAIRKALAEIGGKICVVISREKITFHDFSMLLVSAGATNAINLVGSTSRGFYIDAQDKEHQLGSSPWSDEKYVNYIVWQQP